MTKNNLSILLCLALSALSITAYAANDSGVKVAWGYEGSTGPANWGNLNPDFAACGNGTTQSPVNISNKVVNGENELSIYYQADPLVVVDDGDTTLRIGKTQTVIKDGHGLQVNFPTKFEKEIIKLSGREYQLLQFHMHTPGENKLHGKSFPLELHFVHQGRNGTVAVIGVFVRTGEANPVLQKIIDHIPDEIGVAKTIEGEKINPRDLIPMGRKYYTFMGSLTTPPCSEGLRWIVMQDSITASAEQIEKIKAAAHGANARPIQPLNDRKVIYTKH